MILYYSDSSLRQQAESLIAGVADFSVQELDDSRLPLFSLYLQSGGLMVLTPLFPPFNLFEFYTQFIKRRSADIKRETLLQAVNLKGSVTQPPNALDLTAGLGRDALLLALAGFQVTMVERNPYLAVILNYLVSVFGPSCDAMKVIYARNEEFLLECKDKFDLIYLDPMFMDNKSAKSKKDMQVIDYLIRQSPEFVECEPQILYLRAKECCTNRIVVKRDNKQATLISIPKPTYSKTGKTIRFDVYQIC